MNQARSPFSEMVLTENFPNHDFFSTGVKAINGTPIMESVVATANEWGLHSKKRSSTNFLDDKASILDADLILLSLLASHSTSAPMYLMREHQEFKGVSSVDTHAEISYVFMDLQQMKKVLYIHTEEEVVNYVALMSLMGNDFLPHSVTHRLTDDGHDLILREHNH